ncbi:hypothetical protein GGR09_001675 [Bartonella heixiaziensis]
MIVAHKIALDLNNKQRSYMARWHGRKDHRALWFR